MPEVLIKPTIGRRIWYWPGYLDLAVPESAMHLLSDQASQPFDAGVIYVHSDTCVNLQVTDHRGGIWFREKVRILQEGEDSAVIHENGVAQWMHYQAGQAAREKEKEVAQTPQPVTQADEHKAHKENVLYPAIHSAMLCLQKIPTGSSLQVDQALNFLYDAFWSETPAPASATPKRTIFRNPYTGQPRDRRDIETDPYAILCAGPDTAAIPAELVASPSTPPILRGPGMCMGERCQEHAGTDHSPECLAETALAQKWPEDREWRRVMAQAARAYVKRDEELLNAGRVTYEFLQGEIARRFFFTAKSALGEVAHNGMGLDMVTICVLVLHNGVKYVGVNYGSVVPEHFDKERGMSMAAEEAEQTLRAALTLRLRELQHRARVKA